MIKSDIERFFDTLGIPEQELTDTILLELMFIFNQEFGRGIHACHKECLIEHLLGNLISGMNSDDPIKKEILERCFKL